MIKYFKVGGEVPNHVMNSILPFIRLVFDSLLVHASDVELVPVCSESLFYLICSFPNHFEPVLNEKSQQCTQEQKDKINQSFMPVFQQKKEHFTNWAEFRESSGKMFEFVGQFSTYTFD